MNFGEKVKSLRKKKGWTQGELGLKAKIHAGHISRIENGVYLPSSEVLKNLASSLEVSTDYLLNEGSDQAEVKIEDQTLAERIRLLNQLDGRDKDVIVYMIDALLTKRRMVEFAKGIA